MSILQFSCSFWMPAQAVNFAMVPNQYRVVYIGAASFLWVNILCVLKRGKGAPQSGTPAIDEKLS